jgi:phospholipid transport system transporter-binding protein
VSQAQLTPAADGEYRLSGELSFRTVPDLLRQSRELFEGCSTFVVDMKEVTRADSAGLALLLEWLKGCRRRQQDLFFRNLPEALSDIARVSNLSPLLGRLIR